MPPLAATVPGAGLPPLTMLTATTSWRVDPVTLLAVAVVALAYLRGWRSASVGVPAAAAFVGAGCGLWLLSTISFVGVYDDALFWVRALQFVILLMVVPLGLALGAPVTIARRSRWGPSVDAALHTRVARWCTSPPVTSLALLATPWLIYLTGWYPSVLTNSVIDVLTRLWLVAVGFGYFYARLQVDPVPRRYSPALSLVISAGEAIGDGVLGVVLWQGPLLAAAHYAAVDRGWGPSLRTDQTIGAGVLWILGDVVGVPFLLALFARFTADDRERADRVDAQLDSSIQPSTPGADSRAPTLWWETDDQLRDRFDR